MKTAEDIGTVAGIVTKFSGNGRKLGYPTANMRLKTKLRDGIYLGRATLANFKNHPSIIFIGTPTTLGDKTHRIEAYLLDVPDQDYYGQNIHIKVQHFVRSSVTFATESALIEQMHRDEQYARKWFGGQA